MTNRSTILIVDDSRGCSRCSVAAGRRLPDGDCCGRKGAAWRSLTTEPVALVVLDIMLPGTSGAELCRRVEGAPNVPIVLLTALGGDSDRVQGLEAGADDYVTKPFRPRELVLRVAAILRRVSHQGSATVAKHSAQRRRVAAGRRARSPAVTRTGICTVPRVPSCSGC